jgi:hypothetical protein
MLDQSSKNADVSGASQAPRAQHHADPDSITCDVHRVQYVLSSVQPGTHVYFGHLSESGQGPFVAATLQRGRALNPDDPEGAQQIVAEYARVLNRDLQRGTFPVSVESLPFAKPTIKTAIKTSVHALLATGQLTEELDDFLETAYVSLADYVAPDLVRLMREYTRAGEELEADPRLAREKTAGAAWQTVADGSRLAGEIARSMAHEAELLKTEFQQLKA